MMRIPRELSKAREYFLVDWDFPVVGRNEKERQRFYKEFQNLVGEKVSNITASTSVAILENIDDAEGVYELARSCGAVATLRKATTIKPEQS
jgi:hypothetical protein